MKWFEHRTTDRGELASKLIKRKFGLEGYGIWNSLIEIIGENMEGDNITEWGFVSKEHTMESLAGEIGCSVEKFKEFVRFCDDNLILERRNNRLFCSFVLDRMNEYARKIVKKEKSEKKETSGKEESTGILENPKNPENPRNNTTQPQHSTTPTRFSSDEVNLGIGGNRPEILKDPPKNSSKATVGDILKQKYNFSPPEKQSGITSEWQDQAFRWAKDLRITLDKSSTGRFLKVFKQAAEGRKQANLNQAYSYLKDYEGNLTNEDKLQYFFYIYENGLQGNILRT